MSDHVVAVLNELVPGGVQRGFISRGTRKLTWVDAGRGSPTVVLEAGAGEPGSLAWAAMLPTLAAVTRVIAYDRAGTGSSDPAAPVTVHQQIEDLSVVISSAGPAPAIVAGHSWGGLIAQLTR